MGCLFFPCFFLMWACCGFCEGLWEGFGEEFDYAGYCLKSFLEAGVFEGLGWLEET